MIDSKGVITPAISAIRAIDVAVTERQRITGRRRASPVVSDKNTFSISLVRIIGFVSGQAQVSRNTAVFVDLAQPTERDGIIDVVGQGNCVVANILILKVRRERIEFIDRIGNVRCNRQGVSRAVSGKT